MNEFVYNSDAFADMPLSAQALYFHLSVRTDENGILNNAKTIARGIGAAESDLTILQNNGFIRFDVVDDFLVCEVI